MQAEWLLFWEESPCDPSGRPDAGAPWPWPALALLAAALPVLTAATWHEGGAVLRCLSPDAKAPATRAAAHLGAEVGSDSPLQWRLEVRPKQYLLLHYSRLPSRTSW